MCPSLGSEAVTSLIILVALLCWEGGGSRSTMTTDYRVVMHLNAHHSKGFKSTTLGAVGG